MLEIIIAIFLLAIIITVIFASYTGTSRVVSDTESQAEIYQQARIALERLLEDLESAYNRPLPAGATALDGGGAMFHGEDQELNDASADRLRFVSTAHLSFSDEEKPAGTAIIEYTVRENAAGDGLVLFRADTPELLYSSDVEPGGFILCDKVRALDFKYYDADGQQHDSWDKTVEDVKGLPIMVTISLEVYEEKKPDQARKFMTRVLLPLGGVIEGQP